VTGEVRQPGIKKGETLHGLRDTSAVRPLKAALKPGEALRKLG